MERDSFHLNLLRAPSNLVLYHFKVKFEKIIVKWDNMNIKWKIFYEDDKRKILYEAKETHWICWKDITIQKATLNHANSPENLVVNCLLPDIKSEIYRRGWPVQDWPIQPLVWKDILQWKHEKWTKPMNNLILWTNDLTSQHKWRGIISSGIFSFFRYTVLDSIWIRIWINFIIFLYASRGVEFGKGSLFFFPPSRFSTVKTQNLSFWWISYRGIWKTLVYWMDSCITCRIFYPGSDVCWFYSTGKCCLTLWAQTWNIINLL